VAGWAEAFGIDAEQILAAVLAVTLYEVATLAATLYEVARLDVTLYEVARLDVTLTMED
jgi:hypothetical protein